MAIDVTVSVATGVMTSTKNLAADDTLVVGPYTYTLKASPGSAFDVDLGSDEATTLINLARAINGEGVASATTYFAGTLPAPGVYATAAAHTITLVTRFPGAWGNGYRFAEGTDGGSAYSITTAMAGGAGDLSGSAGYFARLISLNQINSEVQSHLKVFTEAAD